MRMLRARDLRALPSGPSESAPRRARTARCRRRAARVLLRLSCSRHRHDRRAASRRASIFLRGQSTDVKFVVHDTIGEHDLVRLFRAAPSNHLPFLCALNASSFRAAAGSFYPSRSSRHGTHSRRCAADGTPGPAPLSHRCARCCECPVPEGKSFPMSRTTWGCRSQPCERA